MMSDRMMDQTEAMGAKAAIAGAPRDARLERDHSEASERLARTVTP